MFFPELFQSQGRLFSDIKTPGEEHPCVHFLKLQITCWSMGCRKGVVLGRATGVWWGESYTASVSSTKAGGCAGAVSIRRRHRLGSWMSERYFLMVGMSISCSHPMKNCLVMQAVTLALHITGSLVLFTFCSFNV